MTESFKYARLFGLALLSLALPSLTQAKDYNVSSAEEVQDALHLAQGGDRLLLAPGYYAALTLGGKKDVLDFSEPVEVLPQNPADKPVIAKLTVVNVSNLKFSGLLFDYTYSAGDAPSLRAFTILNSAMITFTNCVFDGDAAIGTGTFADGFGTGIALGVTDSKSIKVENSLFLNWLRAAVFSGVEDLTVTQNEVTSIRSDGFDFAAITGARIEANHMHDFRLAPNSGDHWDMIQFWTNGTKTPSTDIVIRNNFLDAGTGGGTQSIFMRNDLVDRGLAGDEMLYRNILVEGNVIRNAHGNAIVVGETQNVKVRHNTLLQAKSLAAGGKVSVPSIRVALPSRNVEITANILPKIPKLFNAPPEGWIVSGNIAAQRDDSSAANYYGRVFIDALADKSMRLFDLAILPQSALAGLSIGSPLSTLDVSPDKPVGIISNKRGEGGILHQDFSLFGAYGPLGPMNLSAAVVNWSFGDGESSLGRSVSHTYQMAGTYKVSATVKLPDQTLVRCERTILVGYETSNP
jgi:hypothetical protein